MTTTTKGESSSDKLDNNKKTPQDGVSIWETKLTVIGRIIPRRASGDAFSRSVLNVVLIWRDALR